MAGRSTKAVHGDGAPEERTGPLSPAIQRTSAFRFGTLAELEAAARGETSAFYTRYGHPSFDVVERKHAALHGAEDAVLFASGMGAMAAVLQGFAPAGSTVVAQRDLYGGTRALLRDLERTGGLDVVWVPAGDKRALAARLPGATLFLGESPTNPLLRVIDLRATADACRAHEVLFVLDATFDGPMNLTPLSFGVDLVVESATKSLGGHSDLLAGFVAGRRRHTARLREVRKLYGAVADPETAWLLDRGMKTLATRVARQNATALALAGRLAGDPRVLDVRHPGLAGHPDRELIARQAERCRGSGGGQMIAWRCAGGPAAARAFVDALRLIAQAPSLGGVESLVCLPVTTSHASVPPEVRAASGVTDDLVRLSVGLEDLEDLWSDIDAALR